MEIIALKEYTDGYISLYQGEIRNVSNSLGQDLINKNIAALHDKDILNNVTTQDNGKILTVVNGKPTFVEKTSELPEVTTLDNGNVLKVIEGTWAKAEDSNEGNLFVNIPCSLEQGRSATVLTPIDASFTFKKLIDYIDAGKILIYKAHTESTEVPAQEGELIDKSSTIMIFICSYIDRLQKDNGEIIEYVSFFDLTINQLYEIEGTQINDLAIFRV